MHSNIFFISRVLIRDIDHGIIKHAANLLILNNKYTASVSQNGVQNLKMKENIQSQQFLLSKILALVSHIRCLVVAKNWFYLLIHRPRMKPFVLKNGMDEVC